MIKKAFWGALFAALSGVCSLHEAFAAELRGLGLSAGSDAARLTLDLSDSTSRHVFSLQHPDRVVIDLADTHLGRGVRAPPPSGMVTNIRLGIHPHGTLRVVMQLKGPVPARNTSATMEGGHRLVLTLAAPGMSIAAGIAPAAVGPSTRAAATSTLGASPVAGLTAAAGSATAAASSPPAPAETVPAVASPVPATGATGSAATPATRSAAAQAGAAAPVRSAAAPVHAAAAPMPAAASSVPLVVGSNTLGPAASLNSKAVRAVHAPGEGNRDVIVAIDAGHGGEDPGAIGHGGTREKDITLAIARALAARIDSEPGMRAVLTRDRDEFLDLRQRIARAHAAHADMFISVHADSIADRSITGASVYVLSVHGASSEGARWLAERENAADLVAGARPDDQDALEPVLIDAAQSEMIGISASAAERVVNALEGVGELRKAQVQRAGFVVLKSRDIPSMLIETAYISNPTEERRLRTPAQQARLADAIASGVHSYFLQNPPDGTRFKQEHRTLASAGGTATTAAVH